MIVLYDLSDRIVGFGPERFYGYISDHIRQIMSAAELSINEDDRSIAALYQRYAFAYAIAAKQADINVFIDLLFDETHDPAGGWETLILDDGIDISKYQLNNNLPISTLQTDAFAKTIDTTQTMPFCYGTDAQHATALQEAATLFTTEMETQTGLYGVIQSIMPGTFSNYYGDDYHNLVVSCNETLPQFG